VLPLDTAALWASGLKARRGAIEPADVTVIAGFLGAGKTTFLRRVLNEQTDQRTVVLINDFGAANVDSSLLINRGAEVVELPNGCICCSLRGDLATQLRDTVRKYRPQRVLIEPSGVAEVATLLGVLKRPDVADLVHRLTVLTLIDASAFLRDYAHMPDYFEAQAAVSPVLIINKQDLVDAPTLRLIEYTLQPLAPEARVLHARFGAVDREALADALRAPAGVGTARVSRTSSAAQQEGGARTFTLAPSLRQARAMQPASAARASQHDDHPSVEPGTAPAAALGTIARHASHDAHAGHAEHAHAHGHDHGHEHERGHGKAHGGAHTHHGVELGYVTWNGAFDGQAGSIAALEALLQQARNGAYGTLRRAKGIVNVGDGWVRFDLAGARVHIAAHVPAPMERSRATAIGESIDTAALDRAFDALMKATAERSGPLVVGAPLLAT
jgi:G3E family GTPase